MSGSDFDGFSVERNLPTGDFREESLRAFKYVGKRQYVEGVPFGGWMETGDCYISDGPLWEGDIDLLAEVDEYVDLCDKQSLLLHGVANALKGPTPELTVWSWADLPEVAQKLVDELKQLKTERQ